MMSYYIFRFNVIKNCFLDLPSLDRITPTDGQFWRRVNGQMKKVVKFEENSSVMTWDKLDLESTFTYEDYQCSIVAYRIHKVVDLDSQRVII